MLFNTLAGAFSYVSMMRWVPQHNWTYTGGDWTAVVGGNKAVFAQTENVDLNQLTQALTAEQVGGRLQRGI
jgi:roadblock/LC7 domain-containing protein